MPERAPGCLQCAKLLARVAQLEAEVRELRARLNTHSGNSSIPPSANPPSAPKLPPKPPTVQTLRLQKRHVLAYLRDALTAHRAGQLAPILVASGV